MKTSIKIFLFSILASSLFMGGCAVVKPIPGKTKISCSAPIKTFNAGFSVKSKSIKYTKFGDGSNTTLLIGLIHGDEPSGGRLLKKFSSYLKDNRSLLCGKTVIIVPIANPDGFAKKTRLNSKRIDLNRNFPADNRINDATNGYFALSEPESWILYKIINIYKPNKILSLHDTLGCIDYDGPATEIAARLAAKCRLPVRKLGSRPGSLGSYVGLTLKIPIITVELSEEDVKLSSRELFDNYKAMLLEAINL
jgi:protein MpaA